jgi:hypothetical protein
MVASFVSLDGVVEAPMTWAGCIRPIGLHEYCASIRAPANVFSSTN